jgi:hypothetical protein
MFREIVGHIDERALLTICPNCGEPLIVERDVGFRKPTPEEYMRMVDDPRVDFARVAFLKNRQDEPVVTKMWRIYSEERLGPSLKDEVVSGETLYIAFQDVFFSACAMLMARFQQYSKMTDEEFHNELDLIEAELNAYAAYTTSEKKRVTR